MGRVRIVVFHSIFSQFKKIDYRCQYLYLSVVLKMSKWIYNIQNFTLWHLRKVMKTMLPFFHSKGETHKERNNIISLELYFQHHPNIFTVESCFLKGEIISSGTTASLWQHLLGWDLEVFLRPESSLDFITYKL